MAEIPNTRTDSERKREAKEEPGVICGEKDLKGILTDVTAKLANRGVVPEETERAGYTEATGDHRRH